MSAYLAWRLKETPNIEVLLKTGSPPHLRRQPPEFCRDHQQQNRRAADPKDPGLFSFIRTVPRTDWLPPEIEKDKKDFVYRICSGESPHWTAKRQPFLLETSRPGVFAAGDVRSGSIKCVASAVGEGAMAVQFVHEYLRNM
jgi:thioredoxin reductase (NADPH)